MQDILVKQCIQMEINLLLKSNYVYFFFIGTLHYTLCKLSTPFFTFLYR